MSFGSVDVECFVGKTVTEINVSETSVEVVFSDGSILEIDALMGGMGYHQYAEIDVGGLDVDGKYLF